MRSVSCAFAFTGLSVVPAAADGDVVDDDDALPSRLVNKDLKYLLIAFADHFDRSSSSSSYLKMYINMRNKQTNKQTKMLS